MKKIILCLAMLGLTHYPLLSHQQNSHLAPLTQKDHILLRALYGLKQSDHSTDKILEKMNDAALVYFIKIVIDHNQILNYKIERKKTGWKSKSFINGLMITLMGAASMASATLLPPSKYDSFILTGSGGFFLFSLYCFYRAAHYQQRLFQRLKANERVYDQLKTEWQRRHG